MIGSAKTLANCPHHIPTVPLHAGNLEQPKNSLPAREPVFATRLTIGLPHFGQAVAAASAGACRGAQSAMRGS